MEGERSDCVIGGLSCSGDTCDSQAKMMVLIAMIEMIVMREAPCSEDACTTSTIDNVQKKSLKTSSIVQQENIPHKQCRNTFQFHKRGQCL